MYIFAGCILVYNLYISFLTALYINTADVFHKTGNCGQV